ncbi:MAG TPA: hypothetical protein VIM56_02920 [Rhizomicrobium sp.]
MKSGITGMLLGAALVLAPISAMAADAASNQSAPLAPGSAAGVKMAQDWSWDHNQTAYLIGGAAVVAAAVIIATNDNNHHHNSSSTGTH